MSKPKLGVTKPAAVLKKQRKYVSQADVPACSLGKALAIPQAIIDNYGKGPAKPLDIAKVLDISPTASPFRMLSGAAIAYGLTVGGWNATQVSITPLALKVLKPQDENQAMEGKREALLKPSVIREFLTRYNDAAIPRVDIACNVLEDLGVPKDRAKGVLDLIMDGATQVGFITEIKDKKYANLQGVAPLPTVEQLTQDGDGETGAAEREGGGTPPIFIAPPPVDGSDVRLTRVFISHGKNKAFIDPIRELLKFGQLEAIVSVEKSTVSQPITQKVMNDMRSCGAAIIHVDSERKLIDSDTKEFFALNENVLIEIGAAMALYGERYILVVKDGLKLPSNLQGLFEVRYSGEQLDGNETIKLMGAINDMKSKALPPAG